jgi:hypothetical protein
MPDPNLFMFTARYSEMQGLQSSLGTVDCSSLRYGLNDRVLGVGTRYALLGLQVKYGLPNTCLLDDATKATLAGDAVEVEIYEHRLKRRFVSEASRRAVLSFQQRNAPEGPGEFEKQRIKLIRPEVGALKPKPALTRRQRARASGKEVMSLDTKFLRAMPPSV